MNIKFKKINSTAEEKKAPILDVQPFQNREIPSFYCNFQSLSEQMHFDGKKRFDLHITLSKMEIITSLSYAVFF